MEQILLSYQIFSYYLFRRKDTRVGEVVSYEINESQFSLVTGFFLDQTQFIIVRHGSSEEKNVLNFSVRSYDVNFTKITLNTLLCSFSQNILDIY